MRAQIGKEKILNSALELFSSQGFHKTSIEQIANHCNVSKGLTYNYFKSKEELLLAILEYASEKMFAQTKQISTTQGFTSGLKMVLDNYFSFLKSHKKYLNFQIGLLFQPDLKEIVAPILHKRANYFLSFCEDLFKSSNFTDPHIMARCFIAELDGVALHYLSVFEKYPLLAMKAQIFNQYNEPNNDQI